MSKGDNCPPDASRDFKRGYDKGYEETQRQYGNDIDIPRNYSGEIRDGFLAGKRQARKDNGGSMDTISKCGCFLGLSVAAILVISFDWQFESAIEVWIIILVIAAVLEGIGNARKKGNSRKKNGEISSCGCFVAILIVTVTFFMGISVHEIFPYAIGVALAAMVMDAFS